MIIQYFKAIICVYLLICFLALQGYAQEDVHERHVQVAVRMIGHEILLSAGDSSSLVLPIEKEVDRYKVQFEKELQLSPQVLVASIDRIVNQTEIATSYLVQVEDCESNQVVYSYEMGGSGKQDLVPCIKRMLPKACYRIYFSILATNNAFNSLYAKPLPSESETSLKEAKVNYLAYSIPFISIMVFIGLLIYFRKKKPHSYPDSNTISVGAYQFNTRSMELSFQGKAVELSGKEADLLMLLLNSANSTVERDYMLKTVWGDEGSYIGRTLDVFISKLRKKLEADANVKIVNVRGVGYKLVLKG